MGHFLRVDGPQDAHGPWFGNQCNVDTLCKHCKQLFLRHKWLEISQKLSHQTTHSNYWWMQLYVQPTDKKSSMSKWITKKQLLCRNPLSSGRCWTTTSSQLGNWYVTHKNVHCMSRTNYSATEVLKYHCTSTSFGQAQSYSTILGTRALSAAASKL